MMPEETAQASADLHAKAVVPGHAGRFVLAKHSWDDPYKRLALASRLKDYRLLTPMLGEPVVLSEPDQPFTALVAASGSMKKGDNDDDFCTSYRDDCRMD